MSLVIAIDPSLKRTNIPSMLFKTSGPFAEQSLSDNPLNFAEELKTIRQGVVDSFSRTL